MTNRLARRHAQPRAWGAAATFLILAAALFAWAPPASAETPTPEAPTLVRATGGTGQVALTWKAPENAEAAAVTHYQYQARESHDEGYGSWLDIPDTTGSSTEGKVAGLAPGAYTFKVRAVNAGGAGAASSASQLVNVAALLPTAPLNVGATGGEARVTLSWTAPVNAVPAVIRGYEYLYSKDGGPFSWYWRTILGTTGSSTSGTLTRLTAGSYKFKLRAIGIGGNGAASAETDAVTVTRPAAAPTEAPANLRATTPAPGVEWVRLDWDDLADTTIIRYEIRWKRVGALTWTRWSLHSSDGLPTYSEHRRLAGGVEHQFQVRAVNDQGPGPAAEVRVTPVAAWKAPSKPAGFNATESAAGVVELRWDEYYAGAGDIRGIGYVKYQYRHRAGDALWSDSDKWTDVLEQYLSWDSKADQFVYTARGLMGGGTHHFQLRTVNSFSPSAAVDATVTVTPPSSVPDAPANLRAVPDVEQVELNWDDSTDATITEYEYRWKRTDRTAWSAWDSFRPLYLLRLWVSVAEFSGGGEYQFQVRAVNSRGAGPASEVKARLAAARKAPPPPTGISAAEAAGVVTLSWNPYHGPVRDDVGYYWAEYRHQAGDSWSEWTEAGVYDPDTGRYAHSVRGLRGGPHQFQVRRVNSFGASAAVDAPQVTVTALTISSSGATVTEGDSGETDMTFTITLSGSPNAQVEIRATAWAKGATNPAKGGRGAGRDFLMFKDQNIVFAANATGDALTKTVTVKVLGDQVDEDDETFILLLNNIRTTDNRVVFSSGQPKLEVTGTITDDDDATDADHTISVSDVTVTEGDAGQTDMHFNITLGGSPNAQVEIRATAWAKGATNPAKGGRGAGRDFLGFKDQNIVFAANATGAELTKTVTVTVLGDRVDEDDETFILLLNNIRTTDDRVAFAGGGSKLEATGTITDDDDATDTGHVISVSDASADEGDSGKTAMHFTVTLSDSPSHDVTVSAHPGNGAGLGAATHGVDFRHYYKDRSIVFAANATGDELTKTVTMYVLPDEIAEDDETITLRLYQIESEDHRVMFAGGEHQLEATGTIRDDDGG